MNRLTFEELFNSIRLTEGSWISIPVDSSRKYTMDFEKYSSKTNLVNHMKMQEFFNEGKKEIFARFVSKNNEKAVFIGEVSDHEVSLEGALGFLYGPDELHKMIFQLYNHMQYGITSRSITVEDAQEISTKLLMTEKWYWTASRAIHPLFCADRALSLKAGFKDYFLDLELFESSRGNRKKSYCVRPVFQLWNFPATTARVIMDPELYNGRTKETAYKIVLD